MPPPRIQLFCSLPFRDAASAPRFTARAFSSSQPHAATAARQRRHLDPYAIAQAKSRKAANITRQEALQSERKSALGDPVRGITTPFVESFDTAVSAEATSTTENGEQEQGPLALLKGERLNHYVSRTELEDALRLSEQMAAPLPLRQGEDPQVRAEAVQKHTQDHQTAMEAVARIITMDHASAKDRLRVNVQRCIDTFGRHNTDGVLAPKPASVMTLRNPNIEPGTSQATPRAGPDTGSSEVQIAILTAKIRSLANFLETRGKHDKVNKRNLRLLVHRRQKLLKYLRRSDRGGERWQNLIRTLGLTDGTWRGEISM